MESTIISVVVKSDHLQRSIPEMGQLVRIDARSGLYVVVRVDRQRRVADVMCNAGIRQVEENVSFQRILPVDESTSRAIREFLKT